MNVRTDLLINSTRVPVDDIACVDPYSDVADVGSKLLNSKVIE